MEDQGKKGFVDSLNSRSAFKFGLIAGLGVMFVIGFFILLALVLTGKADTKSGIFTNTNTNTNPTAQPTGGAGEKLADLPGIVDDMGLDKGKFESCMSEGKYTAKVAEQYQDAQAAGGRGTPYSVILAGGKKIPINGALPFASVKSLIDSAIAGTAADDTTGIVVKDVTSADWIRGNNDAKITIVEFSDIDCPFCKTFHATMLQVMDAYKDDVRWVYRHFPLTSLHPEAAKKAEAAECVGEQGGDEKFWEVLDIMFTN